MGSASFFYRWLDVSSCEALDKWALYRWSGRTLGFGNAMDADGQNFELPLLRRSSAQDPLIWRMQTGNQGGLRIEFSPEPPVGISKTMRHSRDRGRGLANWCLPGDACANRAVDRSKVALSSDRLRWTLPSQCSCPVENDDADLMFFLLSLCDGSVRKGWEKGSAWLCADCLSVP